LVLLPAFFAEKLALSSRSPRTSTSGKVVSASLALVCAHTGDIAKGCHQGGVVVVFQEGSRKVGATF